MTKRWMALAALASILAAAPAAAEGGDPPASAPPPAVAPDVPPPAPDAPPPTPDAPPPAPKPLTPPQLIEKSVKDLSRGSLKGAVNDDVKALRRGPLLIHGNYCGVGNRPGTEPIDALDEACMHHDACTKTGTMPSCACNNRLRAEAADIANDPRTKPDIKALATTMVASMTVLICK